jgi:hypothetical protein
MKGVRNKNRPMTRSCSTKPPEDRKKTKSQSTIVTDESSEEETSEEETMPVPRKFPEKKKKVRIAEPHTSSIDRCVNRIELPYRDIMPLPNVPRESRDQPKTFEPIPITSWKRGPAYKIKAAIEDKNRDKAIIAKVLSNPVTLTTEELLGSSKQIREGIKEMLMPKCKSLTKRDSTMSVKLHELPYDDGMDSKAEEIYLQPDMLKIEDLPYQSFYVSDRSLGGVPKG